MFHIDPQLQQRHLVVKHEKKRLSAKNPKNLERASLLFITMFYIGIRWHVCYQFRILRNLRIDIKDRLEEYSQSIEIDIHVSTQSQKKLE